MNQDLMAFWKHDIYPYLLCGEISEFKNDGLVKVTEYGGGVFRPVLILNKEDGLELKEILETLSKNRKLDVSNIENKYNEVLNDELEKYKITTDFIKK